MAARIAFSLSACVVLLLLPGHEAQFTTTSYYWNTPSSTTYWNNPSSTTSRRPNSYNCGQSTFSNESGNITSPNYPLSYENNQFCNYFVVAQPLSTINFSFNALSLEQHTICSFDWIEFTCQSNSISRPIRYCGSNEWPELSFKPCSRVLVRFYSDSSLPGIGFSVSYDIEPISCQGNCTPVAIGAGYNCTCDANQTDPYIAPPYDQCPDGCRLSSTPPSSSTYCACSTTSSTTTTITTTTTRPPPTVPACPDGCYPYLDTYGYPVCYCNVTKSTPTLTTTTPLECPYGCYLGQDSYGYSICHCEGTTRTTPCPFGCYNVTYYYGYSYCECSTPQYTTPYTQICPDGCSPSTDFWGTPYCACSSSSTRPTSTTVAPCYYPCYYDYDIYGRQYCSCSSTTRSPCNYPCYYGYNDYGNYTCLCSTTAQTTTPSSTSPVCNTTYTNTYGTLTSPNYPNGYPTNINCTQFITIPRASSIQITFTDLNIYYSSSENCYYEWVEVTGCDGSIRRYCAANLVANASILFVCTADYTVTVLFHSYYYYYGYRGFRLNYLSTYASSCNSTGGLVSLGSSGSIVSPNYPGGYPLINDCYYLLLAGSGQNIRIRIAFELLLMQNSSGCSTEYINLSCLDGSGAPWIVCGTRIPNPITFGCDSVEVQFHSETPPGSGLKPRLFKLVYYGIDGGQPATTVSVNTNAASMPGSEGAGFIHLALVVVLAMMLMIGNGPLSK